MAATLEFPIGIHSLTVTASLFADASDTVVAACSSAAMSEATNRTGMYTVAVTGLTGLYFAIAQVSGTDIAIGWVMMTTSGTCTICESRSAALALPNTACTTNASLVTSGTGTDQISVGTGRVDIGKLLGTAWLAPGTAGTPDVNSKLVGGTAQTGGDIYAYLTTNLGLLGANIAKTGYKLASDGLALVTSWTVAITGNITGNVSGSVGTVTGLVASNLDTTVSSRGTSTLTQSQVTGYAGPILTDNSTGLVTSNVSKINGVSTSSVTTINAVLGTATAGATAAALATAQTGISTLLVGVTVTTNNDKTGYSLAASQHVIVDSGSITTVTGNVNGSVNSVTAGVSLAASQHVIVDSGTITTLSNLPAVPTDWLTAAGVKADAVTKIQTGLATSANVTAVITHGDTAWVTATGFYTGGDIAGNLLGNVAGAVGGVVGLNTALIDTTTSSRLAATSYTAPPSASTVATSVWAFVIGSTSTGTMLTAIWTWITSAASNIRTAIGMSAANLDTQVAAIPAAVRDVNNLSPAANSLGAAVNVAGGGTVVIQNNIVVPPQVAQDSQIPARITCKRGDTTSRTLTLGTITGWQKVLFTAKRSAIDADSAAIFQVEALSGGGGGLLIWNGEPATDASQASLTVSDATTGTVTLLLSAQVTAGLSTGDLYWDCEVIYAANVVSTPQEGVFSTKLDITQAIS